ncbi:Pirin domain protein [Cellulomonas flavigena DSM 20109]|uniref:Pirin domain protein n=1 Tax=Cellulomonas flavigena (strain ATCC 482 / DSM 20109 / BCRC 11376 / JCM 18109 / NBRC 3775 / NCIMB 8073 / NRS 134) TaxID=446466 RepID=D5UHZ8_CELFN|nr:pirin family protein [Cellulomonas flavigena]ADG73422.1 Pirin domain protein [Cellulomonas flavigena DSM 20109]
MTNLDPRPDEQVCVARPAADVELVEPRGVPLGGPRAMTVRRTLPSRARSLVGPFCFADHYGPDDVAATGGMDVPPHPHTGLQTVTWLFEGSVLHRDALGSEQVVVPGQLNLMTAGRGICHSEEATPALFPDAPVLHGVQLWTALPESARHGDRAFEHVADVPSFEVDGALVRVFMGALGGVASPARAYSPLVAAQVDVPAGGRVTLPVDAGFEHAVLVDTGDLRFEGHDVARSWLAYAPPGRDVLVLEAGDAPVRAVLIGGTPFDEPVLMWWNFVGRTHDEVVEARAQWQAAITGDAEGLARFGAVDGYPGPALPAPDLPNVRLRPRER